MPKKPRIAAVIDIGSNELKLLIAQTIPAGDKKEDKIKYLEQLSYPLSLGRDTFHTGKMSFDKADKACGIIKNFLKVAGEYGVKNIKTMAATAVREAVNMDYILDQIKIKTGVSVQVIDNLEEKSYINKLLMHYAGEESLHSALMVYIGSGSIGVSLISSGKMPFMRNIRVGSLRMGELFGDLEERIDEFFKLIEEFLASFTDQLADEIPGGIRHFIASGQEIGMIAMASAAYKVNSIENGIDGGRTDLKLIHNKTDSAKGVHGVGSPLFTIARDDFSAFYESIKHKTADQISSEYNIDNEKADLLLPAACIYQNLLDFTEAGHITASYVLPCDALLYEMLYPKTFAVIDKQFAKNTLLSAKGLAQRLLAKEEHYTLVHDFALTIFDKMKNIHGLGARDKVLLQTAAILHDCGKFINTRNHYRLSYEMVRGSDIVGLNQTETEMVALMCLYHSWNDPSVSDPNYAALDMNTRVRVSKLTAILRVADSLDRSHKHKIDHISVKIANDVMTVTVVTDANTSLEQWSFNEKGRFFWEVFGIKALLRVKRVRE